MSDDGGSVLIEDPGVGKDRDWFFEGAVNAF